MFRWKKAAAVLVAAAMTAAGVGCTAGSGTAYAMTIDGVQVNAGIYIYYSYASYMELTQTLQSENSELDVSDKDVVKEQKMDGVSSEEWIKNKALEYCQRYVAIEKKFEELDLSLTEEENKEISSTIDSFWDTNGELYEKNGIAKSSVQSVLENTYMTNDVFLYYYGLDGEEGTTEDDLKQYYEENNARVRYIKFNLTDGNGEALDDAGKKDMKAKVEDYLGEINALKGDEDAMEDEMDTVQSDYNAYVTSISEEAAAATATSATDADGNEIPATTEETTTTTEETTTTTTAAAEDSAAATETAGDSDSEETTATEETAAEETTTEAAVETDENGSEVTTTTTAPYANEQIIAKVTTKEDTKEEDITYTPCKNVYDYAFGDGQKNYGDATIIEDDDAYYIVMSRDIKDRMTEDDLWTESQQNTVISQEYSDAFEDMLDGWTADQKVEKNDSAIKRYDAFKIDMDSSSQSA